MDGEKTKVDETWGMSVPEQFPDEDGEIVVFSTLDENTSGIMNYNSYYSIEGLFRALCQYGGMICFLIFNSFGVFYFL